MPHWQRSIVITALVETPATDPSPTDNRHCVTTTDPDGHNRRPSVQGLLKEYSVEQRPRHEHRHDQQNAQVLIYANGTLIRGPRHDLTSHRDTLIDQLRISDLVRGDILKTTGRGRGKNQPEYGNRSAGRRELALKHLRIAETNRLTWIVKERRGPFAQIFSYRRAPDLEHDFIP